MVYYSFMVNFHIVSFLKTIFFMLTHIPTIIEYVDIDVLFIDDFLKNGRQQLLLMYKKEIISTENSQKFPPFLLTDFNVFITNKGNHLDGSSSDERGNLNTFFLI